MEIFGDSTLSTFRQLPDSRDRDCCEPTPNVFVHRVHPFLKWPGGKRWIAPWLADVIRPELGGTYYEPFLGGGAVFLQLNPRAAVLSDINEELITSLDVIRKYPRQVVQATRRYKNTKACYEKVRKMVPRTEVGLAARFLYLNRTCWGGIYRLNRKGEFNTPFGNSGRPICRQNDVLDASDRFNQALLKSCDFEEAISNCRRGDVVYLDPPYAASGADECFARYNQRPFVWEDHLRLAVAATQAARRGALVVLSAFWRDEFLTMYRGWWSGQLIRHSNVSRSPGNRRKISEVLIFNRVPQGLTHTINGKIRLVRRLDEVDRCSLPATYLAG